MTTAESRISGIRNGAGVFILLAILVLFSSKSLYNIPFALMAVGGLLLVFRNSPSLIQNPVLKTYFLIFLSLWLPLLASLPDAVNFSRSMHTTLAYLRFLFAGVLVIHLVSDQRYLQLLEVLVFLAVGLWCLDALIQFFFGMNLFGSPYVPGHITGIFYPDITIGHITAVLSPIYFDVVRRYVKEHKYVWVLLPLPFVIVLLSGRRAAWIMLIVSVAGYVYCYMKQKQVSSQLVKKLIIISGVVLLAMILTVASSESLQNRFKSTEIIFSGDIVEINRVAGGRLDIWKTSLKIFSDNWINGVGPRGFRYVYSNYSDENDAYHSTGQTHPHQLIFEVLAETGIAGMTGLLFFVAFLSRFIIREHLFPQLYPPLLAVFVCLFPVNTHMAFYGSYWSSVFWWLMMFTFCAASIIIRLRSD